MTPKTWTVNASPLILFARVGRLDLIEQLAPAIAVPDAVIAEVQAGAPRDLSALAAVAWATRFRIPNLSLPPSIERWNLGAGESQVINCCLQGDAWAVLDDKMARRCLRSHGLLMIGSLGIALRAKEQGLIDAARPLVERLIAEGMFAADSLVERALAALGEPRSMAGDS